jgi:hypothetical protein
VWRNSQRLRALLADQCPAHHREIAAIAAAAECGIPQAIAAAATGVPWEAAARHLAQRMSSGTVITEDAYRSVVESWNIALGRVGAQSSVMAIDVAAQDLHAIMTAVRVNKPGSCRAVCGLTLGRVTGLRSRPQAINATWSDRRWYTGFAQVT